MENKNLLHGIKEANSQRYENPEEVDGYLSEPYHSIRSSEGVDLLKKGLDRQFAEATKKIIEIAASTGKVARLIDDSCKGSVIASDIEYTPLMLARQKGLNCVQFDASMGFPFLSNTYHGIYMGELIEHIFDTSFLLSECNRILVEQGILVITTPNLAGLQDRISFLFGISPRHVNPLHEYLSLHIRPFTYDMLNRALRAHGFKVVALRSNLVRIRFSSGNSINSRLLARLFPSLGGSLVVEAQKNSC